MYQLVDQLRSFEGGAACKCDTCKALGFPDFSTTNQKARSSNLSRLTVRGASRVPETSLETCSKWERRKQLISLFCFSSTIALSSRYGRVAELPQPVDQRARTGGAQCGE